MTVPCQTNNIYFRGECGPSGLVLWRVMVTALAHAFIPSKRIQGYCQSRCFPSGEGGVEASNFLCSSGLRGHTV